jgi:hypothetical protein
LVQPGHASTRKRKRATQLATGLMPPEARLAGILAWRQKKFTKNFSNGKNSCLSAEKFKKSKAYMLRRQSVRPLVRA